ncbi:MAG: NifU family protein [Bacilli bacterium]
MNEIENQIKSILIKLRPFLLDDGGDIKFIKYEDNIVYVEFLGACTNCPMRSHTLKLGIEEALKNEMPEIKEVININ